MLILEFIAILIHELLIKYVGFENVYEGFKNAAEAAKAAELTP
ncbi:MAG: hypothetical protein ACJAV5_002044 [Vicingaceae bacterium]|jgi:hypothetical protein